MALPKIDHSIFEVELASDNKTYKFRPFTVKEEKLLLMVASGKPTEDKDNPDFVKETVKTMKQIVNNCCLDELDVDVLPNFDIEWIFLNLRMNSVGETIDLKTEKDGVEYRGTLNLKEVKVYTDPDHNKDIQISANPLIGIILKYPSFDLSSTLSEEPDVETIMKVFSKSIDKIYEEDTVTTAGECSEEELNSFIESLPSKVFKDISKFFETMPVMKHDVILYDESGKKSHTIKLKGISDFF